MNLTVLDDLVDSLRAAGIRSVDTDPANVNTPGVWVTVPTIRFDRLGGDTLACQLVLIVDDQTPRRALDQLGELVDQCRTVVDFTGPASARLVQLPDRPVLPGLSIPVDIPADYDN